MMRESTVKLIIALQDSDLDEEELDKLTKNLLQEINTSAIACLESCVF
ncbi:hypothetical protein F7734_34865 [Scytonema sp. UIC 10036]|nr:hypothetical protein [Scytonema sp. UIC 10036]MUG97238.1 hypothetical protein [Scytonema sp. UIC 10036]